MVRIGMHVSIAGSIDKAVDRAKEKGCDTFQIFSRNPRGWSSKVLSEDEIGSFVSKLKASGIDPAVDHMPYLPNLASSNDETYQKSADMLSSELRRCNDLKIPYLVTHLGSHLGSGFTEGSKRIVAAIERAFSEADNPVMLLLENTAGTKNSMGGSLEDIASIIEALHSDRAGICLDTCHLFAAGYDIRTESSLEDVLARFDDQIGLERLRLIHLNDSKGGLGSRLDRHEHIGLGAIGEEGFKTFLAHRYIRSLPMILETPIDSRRDDLGNLRVARELAGTGSRE
ncbi:MAG TPA: deoxyribonuclease IV [Methanotrichaceae archaeon]|nr:deoxyribonuclease IV [Methanotrichaceae archaeon]